MKAKLRPAIANYSSTSTDTMCSPRPTQLLNVSSTQLSCLNWRRMFVFITILAH